MRTVTSVLICSSRAVVVAALVTVAGCATYSPLPLGNGQGVASVWQLSAPTASMPLPAHATHRFDLSDGLDVTELAMLAVANSPALKVDRANLGIARAQAFSAGLLPDPQIALGQDFPRTPGAGLVTAFNLGLTEDITALLTRSSKVAAARGRVRQVNLDLLWSEWQTVVQARLLFDQVTLMTAQQTRLQQELAALTPVDNFVRKALQAGNLTYDAASAGLNAEASVRTQLGQVAVQLHKAQSDLHVLLGLAPIAPIDLVGSPYDVTPTAAQIDTALACLPQRRPDLLALQAGYASQNAALRGAILAQFPPLTVGVNTQRDTGSIYTNGYTVGSSLPLFNRNRGNIAIERATRVQLKDAYQLRVLTARSDVKRLQADLDTLDQQLAKLEPHVRELDRALRSAEKAWQQGLLDWPLYLAIRSNALAGEMELLTLQQEQAKQSIALQALLGNTDISTADIRQAPTKAPQP